MFVTRCKAAAELNCGCRPEEALQGFRSSTSDSLSQICMRTSRGLPHQNHSRAELPQKGLADWCTTVDGAKVGHVFEGPQGHVNTRDTTS